LVEGGTDAAALGLVFDNDEAKEALAGSKAVSHGVDSGEHAVESEGHVIVFGELEDGEHATDAITPLVAVSNSRSG
jgi:methionine synthase I (cobalamin-dependent)